MEITQESIQNQIPSYLTREAKTNLIKALNDFPKINYYTNINLNGYLQGDGWPAFEIISFETQEKKSVRGIILSNSCDIDSENKRDFPVKINFAPIIRLDNYLSKLKAASLDKEKIQNKENSIRKQLVSSLFYLPQGERLETDYVALLDDIHSIPLSHFKQQTTQKLFTLSQVGFYLFLFKISVHFCRFQEGINRH